LKKIKEGGGQKQKSDICGGRKKKHQVVAVGGNIKGGDPYGNRND